MFKRTLTGAGYIAVLVGFFLLREFIDTRLFHILTCFLLIVGTIEVSNAVKEYVPKIFKVIAITESALAVPIYCAFNYLMTCGKGFLAVGLLIVIGIVFVSIYAVIVKNGFKRTLPWLLPFVYPLTLLLFMMLANDSGKGFIILLLSFVVSPLSDTFAYLVGSLIGGKKLCPKLSPKKTWSGAIGGTVGGALGALVVYLIFKPSINFPSPVLFFILIGLIASVVNVFGDLFESYVKRRVNIKDMGKILPGHGGIMDRIDGTSFVIVFIYLAFLFV